MQLDSGQKKEESKRLSQILDRLKKQKSCIFAESGKLLKRQFGGEQNFKTVLPEAVFCLNADNYQSALVVLDENEMEEISLPIDTSLQFQDDANQQSLYWVDRLKSTTWIFLFIFDSNCVIQVSRMLFETAQENKFRDSYQNIK